MQETNSIIHSQEEQDYLSKDFRFSCYGSNYSSTCFTSFPSTKNWFAYDRSVTKPFVHSYGNGKYIVEWLPNQMRKRFDFINGMVNLMHIMLQCFLRKKN